MSQPTHKLFEVYALITVAALALLVLSCIRDQTRLPEKVQTAQLGFQRATPAQSFDSAGSKSTFRHTDSFPSPQNIDR